MGWLTFGYFASYIPYAMLVKALAGGVTPLSSQPVNGFQPLRVAGWRHMRQTGIAPRSIPVAGRETLAAGFFTSLIVGTTTMNYTFPGVSVLFMLLLMRGGVLVRSPLVGRARKRHVRASAWVGMCLSLIAVSVALGDVNHYRLTVAAAVSVPIYLVGHLLQAPGAGQLVALVFGVGAAAAPACPSVAFWWRTRARGGAWLVPPDNLAEARLAAHRARLSRNTRMRQTALAVPGIPERQQARPEGGIQWSC